MEKINIARRRWEKQKSLSLNSTNTNVGKMKNLALSIVSALNEIINVIHIENSKLTMEIFSHSEHHYCLSVVPAFKMNPCNCLSKIQKGSLNKKRETFIFFNFQETTILHKGARKKRYRP